MEELTGGKRISPLVNRTAPTGSRRPSRSLRSTPDRDKLPVINQHGDRRKV